MSDNDMTAEEIATAVRAEMRTEGWPVATYFLLGASTVADRALGVALTNEALANPEARIVNLEHANNMEGGRSKP